MNKSLIVIILAIFAITVFSYLNWNDDLKEWQKYGSIILALTLVFIIKYVYDTSIIAQAASKQTELNQKELEYIERPSLAIDLKPIEYNDDISDIIEKGEYESQLFLSSSMKFNLEVFIDVIIKVGNITKKNKDPYLSGLKPLKIFYSKIYDLRMPFNELNEPDISKEITDKNAEVSIQVAIYSKHRIINSGSNFIHNEPILYCWNVPLDLKDKRTWLWDIMPIDVPKEMQNLAFKN